MIDAPKAPAAKAAAGPTRVPGGTEMVTMTIREARATLGRGNAARPDVFLMGEEVAEYQGAYKVSPGPAEIRQARDHDHRAWFYRHRRQRGKPA
jgi:hypothetical protein